MLSLQNDNVPPLPPHKKQKMLSIQKQFKCRMCTDSFTRVVTFEGGIERERPKVLKKFCKIINFNGKPVPDEFPKDINHFCLSCELAVMSVVEGYNAMMKAKDYFEKSRDNVFSKVKVTSLPGVLAPRNPDWLTELMTWMMMKANASDSARENANEGHRSRQENGISPIRFESVENLAYFGDDTGLGTSNFTRNDESLFSQQHQNSVDFTSEYHHIPDKGCLKRKSLEGEKGDDGSVCQLGSHTVASPMKSKEDCNMPPNQFKCRMCTDNFEKFVNDEVEKKRDRTRAHVMKKFCDALKFTGKPPPENFPRDSVCLCKSCEKDVRNMLKAHENAMGSPNEYEDCKNKVLEKVKVPTLPPAQAPGLPAEADWFTYFMEWIIKEVNAKKLEEGEKESASIPLNVINDTAKTIPNNVGAPSMELNGGQNVAEPINLHVAPLIGLNVSEDVGERPEAVARVTEPGPLAGYNVTPRKSVLGVKVYKLAREFMVSGTMKRMELLSCGVCQEHTNATPFTVFVCKPRSGSLTTFQKLKTHILGNHIIIKKLVKASPKKKSPAPVKVEPVEPPHTCKVCGRPWRNTKRSKPISRSLQIKMDAHMFLHKNDEERKADYDERKPGSTSKKLVPDYSRCEDCGRVFATAKGLALHKRANEKRELRKKKTCRLVSNPVVEKGDVGNSNS